MKITTKLLGAAISLGAMTLALTGCAPDNAPSDNNANGPTNGMPTNALSGEAANAVSSDNTVMVTGGASAMAKLKPTANRKISGTVTFTKEANGVLVVADLTGLKPGMHGFHVHEKGDCSAPDAASAGGHFNPMKMDHGAPDAAKRHEGDLGNITANASGKAHMERVDKMLKLDGADSIIGRAVIVHEGKDDLKSQPSGDAGARGACGVIEAKK